MFRHGETVERIPMTGITRDAHRAEQRTYGTPESIPNVGFAPARSTERDGTQVTTPAKLYVPHEQQSGPHDRWRVRGLLYEQDGDASPERNPLTGWSPGQVIYLRRVVG